MSDTKLTDKELKAINSKSINTAKYALSTIDNPYDPFNQFEDWFQFDSISGYNSCELLARIAKTSDSLSDAENDEEILRAINEILDLDFLHIYKLVLNPDFE